MSGSEAASSFSDTGLSADLCARATSLGFVTPTPIQAAAIPALLAGQDVLAQAPTGTGKTAAFGLPLVAAAQAAGRAGRGRLPLALVLVPTRELAAQVARALAAMGNNAKVTVVALTGGSAMGQQRQALAAGADVVVATPGRLLDHLRRVPQLAKEVRHLVLDEADEMLDMGFQEDLEAILSALPEARQTALFSATLPPRTQALSRRHLRAPKVVSVKNAKLENAGGHITQWAHGVARGDKLHALVRVLEVAMPPSCIVFCRTRGDVEAVEGGLTRENFQVAGLHGGMGQPQRDTVMRAFRAREVAVLVATDVAARGLDVDHVALVVNFDLPEQKETYVHRVGRTGRAGRAGAAVSLVERRQVGTLAGIARHQDAAIPWKPLPSGKEAQHTRSAHTRARVDALAGEPLPEHWQGLSQELAGAFSAGDLAQMVVQLAAHGGPAQAADIPSFVGPERGQKGRVRQVPGGHTAQAYVELGRRGGMGPRDLVACMHEVGALDPRVIGRIEMGPHSSLVEVPAAALPDVVANMRGLEIDGHSIEVRPERGAPRRRAAGR